MPLYSRDGRAKPGHDNNGAPGHDHCERMNRNEAHPITVEVVRNAVVAYADEMANALSKAAYNMMILRGGPRLLLWTARRCAGPHDLQ